MAIVLLDLYQSDNGRWFARLQNDATGQIAELGYAARPTAARARADVIAVFSPPTVNVTAEDGTTVAVVAPQAFSISLTGVPNTTIASALTTINTLVNAAQGHLGSLNPSDLAALRAHSPLLDSLLQAADRLRS